MLRQQINNHKTDQSGYTFFELLVVMAIIGVFTIMAASGMKVISMSNEKAYRQQQREINQRIADAITEYAEDSSRIYNVKNPNGAYYGIRIPNVGLYNIQGDFDNCAGDSSQGTVEETFTPFTKVYCLRSPYFSTDGKTKFGIADPADSDINHLTSYIVSRGVPAKLINSDGTAGDNIRVYQKGTGLRYCVPFESGLFTDNPSSCNSSASSDFGPAETVELDVDVGVIYLPNRCQRSTIGTSVECGLTAGQRSMVPGAPSTNMALAIVAANIRAGSTTTSWTPVGTDIEPVYFSTIEIEKRKLGILRTNVKVLMDALKNYAKANSLSPLSGRAKDCSLTSGENSSTTTYSPFPRNKCYGGIDKTQSNTSQVAVNNQGCWDGWYNLSDTANVKVLKAIGLSGSYGVTPWGGTIEYCADYSPAGYSGNFNASVPVPPAKSRNTPPHAVAIRFNRALSYGVSPIDFWDPSGGLASSSPAVDESFQFFNKIISITP